MDVNLNFIQIPPGSTNTIGVQVMKQQSFFPHSYWYWIGVGALLGFVLLFNILYTLALTFLNPFDRTRAVILDGGHQGNKKRILELTNQGVPLDAGKISHDPEEGETIGAGLAATPREERGMLLPFEPCCITFEDIGYSVDMPQVQ